MLCFHYHSVWNTLKPPLWFLLCCCSVVVSDTLQHYGLLARQASLSFTISQSLLKFMSIEPVMPSNYLILCCPFLLCLRSFPASGSLAMSRLFISGGQNIGTSASTWVLPMNIQERFPLGLTGLISLLSKGLSRVFSNTTRMCLTQSKYKLESSHFFCSFIPWRITSSTISVWFCELIISLS